MQSTRKAQGTLPMCKSQTRLPLERLLCAGRKEDGEQGRSIQRARGRARDATPSRQSNCYRVRPLPRRDRHTEGPKRTSAPGELWRERCCARGAVCGRPRGGGRRQRCRVSGARARRQNPCSAGAGAAGALAGSSRAGAAPRAPGHSARARAQRWVTEALRTQVSGKPLSSLALV